MIIADFWLSRLGPLVLLLPKLKILLSNLSILGIPDEGYPRNVPDEGYPRNVPDEGYPRNVPDEGYLRNVPDEGYLRNVPDEGYLRNVPDEGYPRNVPDEGYLRNALCGLNLISRFLLNNKPFAYSRNDFKIILYFAFYMSYFPFDGRNGTWCNNKSNGKDNEYSFLIICRYLNLVKKKPEDNFLVNRKFISCYNIKIGENICYFH